MIVKVLQLLQKNIQSNNDICILQLQSIKYDMHDHNLKQIHHLLKNYYNSTNHKTYHYVVMILNNNPKKEY